MSIRLHALANPARFLRFARRVQPWLVALTVLCIGVGGVWALFFAPADFQQGESVRIMYVHVPAAWMALFAYMCMAAASAGALIWRHPLGHVLARAAAPIGACFTLIALVTGSLWGKPMWGAWWVWDARLTSVLILFFLYLGYIALTHAFDDPGRGARAAAILAIVGIVNLPIIKFSVDWWNTLHQPASIIRRSGPTIDSSMLAPLLLMILGFTFYFFVVLILRARAELAALRVRALKLRLLEA
ncbi:MAG: heme ABC transporter permease [Rhodospirillaceae bacterium]|nr:heme ABC transporter permease [Rhodospirillaceae bacterium]